MDGQATISAEILARYAADAACEVAGVRGLQGRHGVRVTNVTNADDRVAVELHLALDWGVSIPEVGREIQERVADYLAKMADIEARVDVIVDAIE
jgi:uncharacterized alkaline shock family protein YloU